MTRREPFEPAGFFVLRAPLLPFDDYLQWTRSESLEAGSAEESSPPETAPALVERLRLASRDAVIREALYIASPGFEAAVRRWDAAGGRPDDRVVPSLLRYLQRMTSRPTPFGLFASISTGRIGTSTHLMLPPRSSTVRRSRIDHLVLSEIVDELLRHPRVMESCPLTPSSSLYEAGGRLRFVRYRTKGHRRVYELAAVEATPAVVETLNRARDAATLASLAAPLVGDGVGEDDARAFVRGLVQRQILVPDLGVFVTGDEPDRDLVSRLGTVNEADEVRGLLTTIREELTELDRDGLGQPPHRYEALRHLAASTGVDVPEHRFVQVDLARPAPEMTLGNDVAEELARCLGLLERLPVPPHGPQLALSRFAADFVERYGEREIPLAEVLDEDLGIGFDPPAGTSAILQRVPVIPARSEAPRTAPVHPVILNRLWEALDEGADEIALRPDDLEAMCTDDAPPLPDALAVVAAVEAPASGSPQDGRILLRTATGPSGAALLGRFCHLDPDLRREVERFLRMEEARRPDATFAEVVHLPQGRTGNVISRPVLRTHEIPYMGRSGAPRERLIPLSDLTVSVQDGRIVLRSRRLQREVIPRLTSAHDFTGGSLAAYRFLGALQYQGTAPRPGWNWGSLAAAPFLPRVRMGRVILARARWRVAEEELEPLRAAPATGRLRVARTWRRRRGIPPRVLLVRGERHLLTDLTHRPGVDAFLAEVKGLGAVRLEEVLPAAERLCATSPEGRFHHELVIPMIRRAAAPRAVHVRRTPGEGTTCTAFPARFVPGSAWLTAKLYTGPAEGDRILREVIGPLVRDLVERGVADRWFFVRYRDPDPHVRLRIHGDPGSLRCTALEELTDQVEALVDAGRVHRLVLDTYARETERYGGVAAMEYAEALFWHDSEAVLDVLRIVGADASGDLRFRAALLGADRLLSDLGLSGTGKLQFVAGLRDTFAREFQSGRRYRRASSAAFRELRPELERLLQGGGPEPLALIGEVYRTRSERSRTAAAELCAAAEAAGDGRFRRAARGLVHMHFNRVLRSEHRRQERVAYDFLWRIYASEVARGHRDVG